MASPVTEPLVLGVAATRSLEPLIFERVAVDEPCYSGASLDSLAFDAGLVTFPVYAPAVGSKPIMRSSIAAHIDQTRDYEAYDKADDILGVEDREVFSPDEYDSDAREINLVAIPSQPLKLWPQYADLPQSPVTPSPTSATDYAHSGTTGSRYAVLAPSTPSTSPPSTPVSCNSPKLNGKGKARQLEVNIGAKTKTYADVTAESNDDWDGLETALERSKHDTGVISPAAGIDELNNQLGESSRSHAAWKMLHGHVHPWCAQEEYARWQVWHARLDGASSSPADVATDLKKSPLRMHWDRVRLFVKS
ncbi:hypothetical protein PENSPDRAFT_684624 [Peniophora sp. CONT]|nr:hypothetical protein PENSPDRAFT_684624 [Peniophora sp. CONT]